jgi:hypothetical protein
MPSAPARFRVLPIGLLCFATAACAGMGMVTNAAGKERMEAMLNAELMTGDSAATVEAFFQRHGIPFTYDASIRRYFGSVTMGESAPLSVYVYTDTDKKMTVTLVQVPKPEPVMRRPRRAQDYLDIPGATAPRPVR